MNQPSPHYCIATTEVFLSGNFMEVDREIDRIKAQVKGLRNAEQCSVMISFFKDHKIRMDLAQSQTILVNILLSMDACRHIESLFEASKENESFRNEFEKYLRIELGA